MKATKTGLMCAMVMIAVVALATGGAEGAGVFAVQCIGTESGGWGGPLGWQYAYEVSVLTTPGNLPMDVFQVGTDDMTWTNYSRAMITDGLGNPIPGWIPVYPGSQQEPEAHGLDKTPHGQTSQGSQGLCLGYVRWAATVGAPLIAPGTSVFAGFDNPNTSHDVGWTANISGLVPYEEDWSQPVGFGDGPVHGPVPEPTTLALLGLGSLAVIRRRK